MKLTCTIKGFTVMEAIIAMILTSIVVLFALSGVRYFQKVFLIVHREGENQTEINQFYLALNNDIQTARIIEVDGGLLCNSYNKSVEYSFLNDKIVRRDFFSSDTFNIKHGPPEYMFSDQIDNACISVSVQCMNNDLLIPIHIVKSYPAALKFESKSQWD